MSEAQPTNPEGVSRTPTGEIKDQTQPQSPTTESTEPNTETTTTPSTTTERPSLVNAKDEAGAPDKYSDFTVPEGFTLDETVAKEAGDLFKGMNLPQAQAQQLVDFYVAKTREANEAPFKLWADTQEKWINEVKADSQIGSKLQQVKATISKAIDGLGDPKLASEFREAMDYTGAGNNPAFIRAFFK